MKIKKPELLKRVFTEKDFEELSWHDSNIFSINFNQVNNSFTLGLDYIMSWIDPEEHKKDFYFRFWKIPAYLKFYEVVELSMNPKWDKEALQFTIGGINRELVENNTKSGFKFYEYVIDIVFPFDSKIILPMSNQFEMHLIGDPQLQDDSEKYISIRNRIIKENYEYIHKIIYE